MSPSELVKQLEIVMPANVLLLAGVVVLTLGLFGQLATNRNVLGGVSIVGMILASFFCLLDVAN